MGDNLAIKVSLAEVLAFAVSNLYPSATLLGGGHNSLGFYYDFHFSVPLPPHMLALIEESMGEIVRQDISIKRCEMVPKNAAAFLKAAGMRSRAILAAKQPDVLVDVFKMDSFIDLAKGPFVKCSSELKVFKLVDMQATNKQTRIFGLTASDALSLQQLYRRYKQTPSHQTLGKKFGLFWMEGAAIYWLPKGEQLKWQMVSYWRQLHCKQGYGVVELPFYTDIKEVYPQINTPIAYIYQKEDSQWDCLNGLFDLPKASCDLAIAAPPDYCLQCQRLVGMQLEAIKHFSLRYRIVVSSRYLCLADILSEYKEVFTIEDREEDLVFEVQDNLHRWWPTGTIKIDASKEKFFVLHSVFGQIDRLFAVIMERHGEKIEKVLSIK